MATRALNHYQGRGEEAAAALQDLGQATTDSRGGEQQLSAAETAAGERLCSAAAIEDMLLWLASYEVC